MGYLAIETGSRTVDGRSFEAGTRDGVDSDWRTLSFDGTYEQPTFLADLQTYHGNNTATVRYRNLTGSSVEVKVEEERSADREIWHTGETLGYLVIERSETVGYGIGGYGMGGYGE